jgi:hypothetical protein
VNTSTILDDMKGLVRESRANRTILNLVAIANGGDLGEVFALYNQATVEVNAETPAEASGASEIPVASQDALVEIPTPLEPVDDAEIIQKAVQHLENEKTDSEVRTLLSEEYEDIETDFDALIKAAHIEVTKRIKKRDAEIEASQAAEDQMRKDAFEAADRLIEAERDADKQLVQKVQAQGRLKDFGPVAPEDIERVAKIIRTQEEEETRAEDAELLDDDKQETFPECPIFTGALPDLARALFPSVPLEFKIWGLITRWGLLRSGLDTIQNEAHLQPRFYTSLICYPNTGKTAANNESRAGMDFVYKIAMTEWGQENHVKPTVRAFGNYQTRDSIDSGQALVEMFHDLSKDNGKDASTDDKAARIMFDPDELSETFEKSRSSATRVSTMFQQLLKLHSGNRTGNVTKKDRAQCAPCHLRRGNGRRLQEEPMDGHFGR